MLVLPIVLLLFRPWYWLYHQLLEVELREHSSAFLLHLELAGALLLHLCITPLHLGRDKLRAHAWESNK